MGQWGQKGNSKQQQWGQKGNSKQRQWGQKGNSQQNKNRWQNKGKWTQQFYNKEHKCTVTKIPKNLQTQYQTEFKALDVDNNGHLDSKEFQDEGEKISEAFSSFRKGKKPSWYKGNKNGNNNQNGGRQNGGRGGNQNGGRNNQNGGGFGRGNQNGGRNQNGGGFGGFGRGGNQNGGQQNNQNGGRGRGDRGQRRNRGGRQLADKDEGGNFWKYLQQQGFISQKPKQSDKDKMESRRAANVFKKFDQDHNNQVSLCEYENAMYRTEMLEKRMGAKNKNNGVVVVHG